jgi:uncharacterized Zn finger protein
MGCPICGRDEITVPYRTESVIYIACNGCGSVSPADLTLMAKRYVDRPAAVQTSDEGSLLFSQASSDISADDESATTGEASRGNSRRSPQVRRSRLGISLTRSHSRGGAA